MLTVAYSLFLDVNMPLWKKSREGGLTAPPLFWYNTAMKFILDIGKAFFAIVGLAIVIKWLAFILLVMR